MLDYLQINWFKEFNMKNLSAKILIGFIFISVCFNTNQAFGKINVQTEPVTVFSLDEEKSFGVTQKAYDKIKIGMSLREICRIIGSNGEEMTRSRGGGSTFTSHKWEGKDYAIITAVFKDSILTNKYEANLK